MDLLPQNIIDTFYIRIERILIQGVDKNHPSVKREVNRILIANGNKLPDKIKKLLEE